MDTYFRLIIDAFSGYWNYLVGEVLLSHTYKPWYENYFYWLIGLSLVVWVVEIVLPWRSKQGAFRRDFWLDGFYMFFNFFLFSLIGYNALSAVGVELFNGFLARVGVTNLVAVEVTAWPRWVQLCTMFVLVDFIHWNVHRLLHRVEWLWEFHKVHHSVKEMGFAAHLRFHWMETVVYKTLQYVPLAMIGFGLTDFFIVHMVALLIGHLNHANLAMGYGPLGKVLNNPKMHIWHHAKVMPFPYGRNFGISLSLWDYLFGTAYIPEDGRDVELGFPQDEVFPQGFFGQVTYPVSSRGGRG